MAFLLDGRTHFAVDEMLCCVLDTLFGMPVDGIILSSSDDDWFECSCSGRRGVAV